MGSGMEIPLPHAFKEAKMKKLIPNINLSRFENQFTVVDSHTVGEFTRIVLDGTPELPGNTMIEKKNYLSEHYDHLRTALMLEPRGHRDMFGAFIVEPVHEEADFGVIFMDTGGYVNMCGHGTIGCSTVAVEAGLVPVTEPYTDIVLDAPAGLIHVRVKVENGKAVEVTLVNVPAFVYKEGLTTKVDGADIKYDIAFGGSFFALVDAAQFGMDITPENAKELIAKGMTILENSNREVPVQHPTLDINDIYITEIYGRALTPEGDLRNIVIFGQDQADRSPCGTGTSAKMAYLYKHGKLGLNQPFVYESFMGSKFRGEIIGVTKVGDFDAIIPQITGSAYITGVGTYLIDPTDPLKYGFLF